MRSRIVIVGGGFAGYHAARSLCRLLRDTAEIVLVNPTDYFLYLPLLPEVAAGLLDPRRVTVSLPGTLPGVRLLLGSVDAVDLAGQHLSYVDPDGGRGDLRYDRLLLTTGSVNKLLPVPGVAEHAHGFRNIAEALYLRDHVIRQVETADSAADPADVQARLTFVVIGAGYTGTEVTGQGVLMTDALLRRHPRLAGHRARWYLIDTAPRVLPGLGAHLAATADRVLRSRGVDIRTRTSVTEARPREVRLSDGTRIPTRSLIWCVGVRPEPLVAQLELPVEQGRLVVDEYLALRGHPRVPPPVPARESGTDREQLGDRGRAPPPDSSARPRPWPGRPPRRDVAGHPQPGLALVTGDLRSRAPPADHHPPAAPRPRCSSTPSARGFLPPSPHRRPRHHSICPDTDSEQRRRNRS